MSTLGFVLQAIQVGFIGIVGIALALTYLLLRDVAKQTTPRLPILDTIKSYMRICLYLAIISGVFQLTSTIIDKVYPSNTARAPSEADGLILPSTITTNNGEWHWHYGAGNWETNARFIPDGDRFKFAADTYFRRGKGKGKDAIDEKVVEWWSEESFAVPKEGTASLKFKLKRKILAGADKLDPTMIAGEYPGTIEFKLGKSLLGKYGGESTIASSNMVLYLPPSKSDF